MLQITLDGINKFYQFMLDNERSRNTIAKYIRDLNRFAEWIGDGDVTRERVLEYKERLCERYAPKSVNSIISSLNAYFKFCLHAELCVRTIKIQRQIFADKSRELSKAEYGRLLDTAKRDGNMRMFYLMQTMASTGIRVSEVKYVTVEAVEKGVTVIRCKGKIRQVFFPKQLCKMLKSYIKKQGIVSGSVFITRTGKPIDRFAIWKAFKKLCEKARVSKDKVFPHNLRHLFARTLYSMQKDIVRLADILGHSSVETTRIYTMESGETHMRQLQKLGLLRW